jgi:hypothetical protein
LHFVCEKITSGRLGEMRVGYGETDFRYAGFSGLDGR